MKARYLVQHLFALKGEETAKHLMRNAPVSASVHSERPARPDDQTRTWRHWGQVEHSSSHVEQVARGALLAEFEQPCNSRAELSLIAIVWSAAVAAKSFGLMLYIYLSFSSGLSPSPLFRSITN